jgi:hypothetical protein
MWRDLPLGQVMAVHTLATTKTAAETDTSEPPPGGKDGQGQEIIVLFTTHAGTVAALKMASRLSANLGARPKLLMLYAVPYTLPLGKRALPDGFLENRVRALRRDFPEEISTDLHLCRHPRQGLREALPPHSLIVVGGRKRCWPTPEQKLAKFLQSSGHQVIFVDERDLGTALTATPALAPRHR